MDANLRDVVAAVERHVAREGWDQPTRLFAIMPTAAVLDSHPELVLSRDMELTSLEQEVGTHELRDLLSAIEWDDAVVGAVAVMERIVAIERDTPYLPDSQASEIRVACAVLRDGRNVAALRYRGHDDDDSVALGADLVPELSQVLFASFA